MVQVVDIIHINQLLKQMVKLNCLFINIFTMDGKNVSFGEINTPLLINHYAIQDIFWCNVKMTRGDVNYWYDKQGWDRNMKLFLWM